MAETTDILLPPPFRLLQDRTGTAAALARAAAEAGAEPGTMAWTRDAALFDCAVVLAPGMPLATARPMLHVGMVALGDTLAVLAPPNRPIGHRWPDRVMVDGAGIGRLALAAPAGAAPDAVPDWLVLAVTLRIAFDAGDTAPGRRPDSTALVEEGFEGVEGAVLIESFSRHLLYWTDRWERDGFAPVGETWLARLDRPDPDRRYRLDPASGDLLLLEEGGLPPSRATLAEALAASAPSEER